MLDTIQHSHYLVMIGELLYLSVCTRPDISFCVAALARQLHAPAYRHMKMAKHILRYIAGTLR